MKQNYPVINIEANGCSLFQEGNLLTEIRWMDIQEIAAFKKDGFTYDLICLDFKLSDPDPKCEHHIVVHEEMAGWKELTGELHRIFSNLDPGWWTKVAFPAFATNPTSVWQRKDGAKE